MKVHNRDHISKTHCVNGAFLRYLLKFSDDALFNRVVLHTIPLCVLCPSATQSLVVCMLTSK